MKTKTITVPNIDPKLFKKQHITVMSHVEDLQNRKAWTSKDFIFLKKERETWDGLLNLLDWMSDEIDGVPHP